MSSGWTGPGSRTAPQNQQDNASYAALKAQVHKDQREKREAENARRASEGLPPRKSSSVVFFLLEFERPGEGRGEMTGCDGRELCRWVRKADIKDSVKDSVGSKIKKGIQKAFMM